MTTASVALPNLDTTSVIIQQGWVLKKRRKKMQGFARRYFTLYSSGILSYAFEPGQPTRDSVLLQQAAISTSPFRKDIHIDANTALFHIKCLSADDFNQWMAAFRKFIVSPELRRSASVRRNQGKSGAQISRSAAIVDEMAVTLAELEDALQSVTTKPDKKNNSAKSRGDKDKKFGLFKKCTPPELGERSESNSSEVSFSPQRVFSALDTLKVQYANLSKAIHALPVEPVSAFSRTLEEEEEDLFSLRRASMATASSLNEWFDASEGEGMEEFVLDEQDTSDIPRPSELTSDSRSTASDNEDDDTDIEEDVPLNNLVRVTSAVQQVTRRTMLPSLPVGDEGSLLSVLKKSVGKDLSTIALPVTFNEPLTLLQRLAEDMEYYELLGEAARAQTQSDRMAFIASFAVSGYANTRYRSGRKGFNPMLGETFEDSRCKFISEKVKHQPVEMAFHAEGNGWEIWGTSAGRTKFWGKSLEIIPLGSTHLRIGEELYEWKRPSSFMRNLVVGTKYLEHVGELAIDASNGWRSVIEFKQNGYWAPSNGVSATIFSPNGTVVSSLEGKWDEQMSQTLDNNSFRILWRISPFPKNAAEYYGFTFFGVTLNEITREMEGRLPPTDSRLRPDVRALENGNLDLAESEKLRVEEMQRERRRRGADRQPMWFREGPSGWEYVGGYWEARAKGWKSRQVEPLW
ncbi:hypothetical protein FISHEDRAFT_66949 [Fistulina hepatica ATCC 64428]|uniref:PH domain-containing protein n=1 Tax=Fistulina hepatica ATCC 64428 TaxID=1128425 RepID=A0A0D7A3S1_9AGAR|nr:hypothetical protein FISHEDRAFT_66949 [Fistulina hepatica ATCC 64428]